MHGTPRGMARLLRALIACLVLLFAIEAPAAGVSAAGLPRDVSSWVVPERAAVAVPAERRVPGAPVESSDRAAAHEPAFEQRPPGAAAERSDGRYLYLEQQTLLC